MLCFSLVMAYTHAMLVLHWSQLTRTHCLFSGNHFVVFIIGHSLHARIACFPVITLLFLSTTSTVFIAGYRYIASIKYIVIVKWYDGDLKRKKSENDFIRRKIIGKDFRRIKYYIDFKIMIQFVIKMEKQEMLFIFWLSRKAKYGNCFSNQKMKRKNQIFISNCHWRQRGQNNDKQDRWDQIKGTIANQVQMWISLGKFSNPENGLYDLRDVTCRSRDWESHPMRRENTVADTTK